MPPAGHQLSKKERDKAWRLECKKASAAEMNQETEWQHFQRVRLKRADEMRCESRQLHRLAAGFICQHGHTLFGTVAGVAPLSRQQSAYRDEI